MSEYPSNPLLERMAAHVTVRDFTSETISDERVGACITAAQQAATSSWIQGYCLLEVESPGERETLAKLCGGQAQVHAAARFFVICGDTRRHRLIAKRQGKPYTSNLECFLLAVVDACLFAQNLTLAFESMDYGTCFIGGLRNELAAASALLKLPHGVYPLFGQCIGVPSAEQPAERRPRLPLDAVWMRGRYLDDAAMHAAMDEHDAEAEPYYTRRGTPGRNWSGGVARRFQATQRDGLAQYYRDQGAQLE